MYLGGVAAGIVVAHPQLGLYAPADDFFAAQGSGGCGAAQQFGGSGVAQQFGG